MGGTFLLRSYLAEASPSRRYECADRDCFHDWRAEEMIMQSLSSIRWQRLDHGMEHGCPRMALRMFHPAISISMFVMARANESVT